MLTVHCVCTRLFQLRLFYTSNYINDVPVGILRHVAI